LIEFDNVEQRDALRERIDTATDAGKNYRVCGIFCSPGRWCTCPRPTGYHKDEIVRGGKFGWWIHIGCRRARKGTHQLVNLLTAQELKLSNTGYTQRVTELSVAEVVTRNIAR
jgi:hypothetical protein